ncbi:hypothetical protein [Streptomyces sp. NPDC016845]
MNVVRVDCNLRLTQLDLSDDVAVARTEIRSVFGGVVSTGVYHPRALLHV